jgi:ABC-type antimicrobial peptide transport system permease subunit
MSQHPPTGAEFVVRAAGNARALVPALRAVLHDEDPALPLVAPRTLQEVFAGMLVAQRFALVFLAAFGGMALVLASLGVYGVTAYSVTARRRELGIRIALGSRRAGVLGLVLKRGMAVALAGTATGTFGALAGVRLIRGLLVGVTPYDPLAFTAATLTLLAVSALASLVPALGATRVRPIDSLRCD